MELCLVACSLLGIAWPVDLKLDVRLILPQSDDWINAACAPRRQKASEQRGKDKDGDRDGESRNLRRLHSLDQPLQNTPRCQRSRGTKRKADEYHPEALPQHQPNNIIWPGP